VAWLLTCVLWLAVLWVIGDIGWPGICSLALYGFVGDEVKE